MRGIDIRRELALGRSALRSIAHPAWGRTPAGLFRNVDRRSTTDRGGATVATASHAGAESVRNPDGQPEPQRECAAPNAGTHADGDRNPEPEPHPYALDHPNADADANPERITDAFADALSMEEDLSPKEAARIDARDRKHRPPKMVVDNAAVRRIQMALRTRAAEEKARKKSGDRDKRGKSKASRKK